MQEQFKSQQEQSVSTKEEDEKIGTETIETEKIGAEKIGAKTIGTEKIGAETIGTEKIGAEKIIDFMKQNNLEPHDLALALSMVLARTTNRTEAEQHIVDANSKDQLNATDIEH